MKLPWSTPTISEIKAAVGYASSGRGEGARDKFLEIDATIYAAVADGVPLDSDEMRERIRKARIRIRTTGGPTLVQGLRFAPRGKSINEMTKAIIAAFVDLPRNATPEQVFEHVREHIHAEREDDRDDACIIWGRQLEHEVSWKTFQNRVGEFRPK
jgi:hypothetical protein